MGVGVGESGPPIRPHVCVSRRLWPSRFWRIRHRRLVSGVVSAPLPAFPEIHSSAGRGWRAFLPPQPRGGISGIQQVPLGDSQGELAAGAGWPKGVAVRGGSGRPLQGGATPPWATLLPAWGLSSPHSSNARGIHKSRWLRNGWDSTWVASSQKPSPCLVD